MRAPAILIAALAALSCAGASAAPCAAPGASCAESRPVPPPQAPSRPQRPRDDIHLDAKKEQDRAIFVQLFSETSECMREGSVAAMRTGSRNSRDIRAFTLNVCAGHLIVWLREDQGMNPRDIRLLVDHMTQRGLDLAVSELGGYATNPKGE